MNRTVSTGTMTAVRNRKLRSSSLLRSLLSALVSGSGIEWLSVVSIARDPVFCSNVMKELLSFLTASSRNFLIKICYSAFSFLLQIKTMVLKIDERTVTRLTVRIIELKPGIVSLKNHMPLVCIPISVFSRVISLNKYVPANPARGSRISALDMTKRVAMGTRVAENEADGATPVLSRRSRS